MSGLVAAHKKYFHFCNTKICFLSEKFVYSKKEKNIFKFYLLFLNIILFINTKRGVRDLNRVEIRIKYIQPSFRIARTKEEIGIFYRV